MHKLVGLFLFSGAFICCTGCATVLSGTHQVIRVETDPDGARCELVRQGQIVAVIESTTGSVDVEKTKDDLGVWCKKPGFGESKGWAESGSEGATVGNILISGLVGWGIDSALGADNKYPELVTVNLVAQAPFSAELIGKLETLKRAKEQGLLTDGEYVKKRAVVLRQL